MRAARATFACGTAVALYTAAAFGVLLYTGVHTAVACLIAAVAGILVAMLAGRLVQAEQDRASIEEHPPEPKSESAVAKGFAVRETREDRESRKVQAALLPQFTPQVSGYHLDVAYDPCGLLGGDFYDFIECGDDRLLITLGDVSGKGPAGAIVMAMVQTLLRREARDAASPADLLRRVNDGFAGTFGKGVFVTAQVAMLDGRNHRFTLAGAGHHPMLLLNPAERRATHVNARGVALGLVRGDAFASQLGETTVDIAPGDSLLLYTDGATECTEHLATGVGDSRFLAAAAAAVLPGPRGALARLDADLWEDGGRRDDTTLLLVSRLGGPSPGALPSDRAAADSKVAGNG